MVFVEDLLRNHGQELELDLVFQNKEKEKEICRPEVHRPGLSLAGFLKKFVLDRILVFDMGHIVEDGSHAELLQQGGLYKTLWDAQVGGFLPDKKNGAPDE